MKNIFNFKFLNSKRLPLGAQAKWGMTLIELLVVITIIGILATIILSSISDSRVRAYDAKVKEQLSRFRTAAEIYFQNQTPNSYGVSVSCAGGMFVSVNPNEGSPGVYIDSANLPPTTQVVCGSNGSAYAVKATLYSGNEYWCVDNRGNSMKFSGPIGGSDTQCS